MAVTRFDRRAFLALAGTGLASCALTRRVARFDCVLSGAVVHDGLGSAPRVADVGILADTIAHIGSIDPEQARQRIDLRGLCLAPGFIDIHTHSDEDIFRYPDDESRVHQGVTTEVTGNCGGSAAPVAPDEAARLDAELREDGIRERWSDVGSYFRALESRRTATNQLLLVGQGTLRRAVAGLANRPLSAGELARVERMLEEALEQGAAGMSTGLEYTPGRYTPTGELVALARVLARRGRLYASHIRNEESGLLESVREALRIGVEGGARVQVSHLKACGRPNWPQLEPSIAAIESARAAGLDVLADAYPYTAYSTGLTIFLSDATREGGAESILARLADRAERARIAAELDPRVSSDPGGYELIVVASTTSSDKSVVGASIAEIAARRGVAPSEALLQLLEEGRASVGHVAHAMDEAQVARVLSHPLVMVASDGYAMAPRGEALERRPHPRSYGTFARVLHKYVREERLLALPDAVRKMTSMPADQMRLADRGRVAVGCKADLVAFDAATVREESTFADPHRLASGFRHVWVNGARVLADGRSTGARPGRALRA